MRIPEEFLHFLWKYQKFETSRLCTSEGISLQVIYPGIHNQQAGPDFFNAHLRLGETLWAGTVEIHVKSSYWYQHQHQQDAAYDTVILHVVWEHDVEIFREDNSVIPTVVLTDFVNPSILRKYLDLLEEPRRWIPCEEMLPTVASVRWKAWLERLFLERMEEKSKRIEAQLKTHHNHWEAVLFQMLCANFGLNLNGAAFQSIARSIPFSVLQKCAVSSFELEALFFGQSGLLALPSEDPYVVALSEAYTYQKRKFRITSEGIITPQFFRLRPANFPTLRLAQLADLYTRKGRLFAELMEATTPSEAIKLLLATASEYWDTHYQFGTSSKPRKKVTSISFRSLLLINTIAPLRFCYQQRFGNEAGDALLSFLEELSPEKNSVVQRFAQLRKKAGTAVESQALLQLKTRYCDKKRCLDCAVGNALITA
ncbi:DUF2851 family protein [Altibacter sp. HG106]|uniref:DUF2851 family protein n=1 Tax=Altibacter sp. HG106 TaxID=3023937 RepID=UPI002350D554|nr:DUF2851 family protein [Altibacter sp. HG106]MDC7996113.1 DUF2851 family protein [Altibacter sp. HG106]